MNFTYSLSDSDEKLFWDIMESETWLDNEWRCQISTWLAKRNILCEILDPLMQTNFESMIRGIEIKSDSIDSERKIFILSYKKNLMSCILLAKSHEAVHESLVEFSNLILINKILST